MTNVTIRSERGGGGGWGRERPGSLSFEEAAAHLERLRGTPVEYFVGPSDEELVVPVWVVLGRARPPGSAAPDPVEEIGQEENWLVEFGVSAGTLPLAFPVPFSGLALTREWFAGAEADEDGTIAVDLANGVRMVIAPVEGDGAEGATPSAPRDS